MRGQMLKLGQKVAFVYQVNNNSPKDAQFGIVIAIHDDYVFVVGVDNFVRCVDRKDLQKISVTA